MPLSNNLSQYITNSHLNCALELRGRKCETVRELFPHLYLRFCAGQVSPRALLFLFQPTATAIRPYPSHSTHQQSLVTSAKISAYCINFFFSILVSPTVRTFTAKLFHRYVAANQLQADVEAIFKVKYYPM